MGWAPPRHTKEGKRDGLRITSFDIEVAVGQSLPIYVLNTEPAHEGNPRLQLLDQEGWSELLKAIDGPVENALQDEGDQDDEAVTRLRKRVRDADGPVWIFAPRGYGPTATNPQVKARTQLRRRYMLLGETLEGMQVWDVTAAIRAVRDVAKSEAPITIEASGELAAAAVYASLFTSTSYIQELRLTAPPKSHREGATYMQVLRFFDMPQAVALAAGRTKVTLLDVDPTDWEWAATTAKNLAWTDKLQIVPKEDAQSK